MMPPKWHWRLYDEVECEVFYDKNRDEKNYIKKCHTSSRFKDTKEIYPSCHTITVERQFRKNVFVHKYNLAPYECKILNQIYNKKNDVYRPRLLFISDIRSNNTEQETKQDMDCQQELVKHLLPYQASLKFKLPYQSDHPVEYLDGEVMLQCFSPPNSHECRLVTLQGARIMEKRNYNVSEYSKKCFNFQTTLRTCIYNSEIEEKDISKYPSLVKYGVATDQCYDCTLCKNIFYNFLDDKTKVLETMETIVDQLAKIHIRCKA